MPHPLSPALAGYRALEQLRHGDRIEYAERAQSRVAAEQVMAKEFLLPSGAAKGAVKVEEGKLGGHAPAS